MRTAFGQPKIINVLDGNNTTLHAKDYNVWVYTPAEAYEIATDLTIVCG